MAIARTLALAGTSFVVAILTSLLATVVDGNKSLAPLYPSPRVLLQPGVLSEQELPICGHNEVCNKVDTYASPWVEKRCLCPGQQACSTSLDADDGFTILDKGTRQYKLCQPIKPLPTCRLFRDISWTLFHNDNHTSQVVKCVCPRDTMAYITTIEKTETGQAYHFGCSPEIWMRCEKKAACRLFSVSKRTGGLYDVNHHQLCQCAHGQSCPTHHMDRFSLPSPPSGWPHEKIYTAYCSPDHKHHAKALQSLL